VRVVIEKPFGRDLEDARQLNRAVLSVFAESQVFRIDHYLGKETLQNLLALRFANELFALLRRGRRMEGMAAARRGDVRIVVAPSPRQPVQGLTGMTLSTRSGRTLSLDRAPGGLLAHQRDRGGEERAWTLLGASRGEAGILGEGIRHALLPDSFYKRAVTAASTLATER
jgi:hypothetical protein